MFVRRPLLPARKFKTQWLRNKGARYVVTIDQTQARLNTHEEVCAIRYDSICARLKRLESIGITVAGAIIMLLIGLVSKIGIF